jgi:hypothetical protein
MIASNLKELLKFEKKQYLTEQKIKGGSATGFRKRIIDKYGPVPDKYLEALAEASDRAWRVKPRRKSPDLFSIGGFDLPEYLTRAVAEFFTGEDTEDDEAAGGTAAAFEQVDLEYATVADLREHAQIHLRKAAQASSKANDEAKAADEAFRRAKGNLSKRLRELADE